VPAGGTHYISLNSKVKPFDNVDVRKAIVVAANRNALRLTAGCEADGDLAGGCIPPGLPGFEEAGGLKQDTDLDFLAHPTAIWRVAKKYMLAARQQDPSLPIDAASRSCGTRWRSCSPRRGRRRQRLHHDP
jgi:peptide/nickel transport system substrate-binding protein